MLVGSQMFWVWCCFARPALYSLAIFFVECQGWRELLRSPPSLASWVLMQCSQNYNDKNSNHMH